MATTTRAVLRQRLSENIGDYFSSTGTTDGTTTTIIDTALLSYLSGGDDDFFEGFQIIDTESAHSPSGQIRRVKSYDFDGTPGTLTLEAALSTKIDSGQTYELHRFPIDLKHAAINRAIQDVYPRLYLPLVDETLVLDNILLNSDFENGTFTSWTTVGSPTVTADTTIVFHGTSAAKIVSSGVAVGQLTQTPTINVDEITGRAISFWCWVYTTAANTARIRIDFGGGNAIENSEFHSGQDQWELIQLDVSVPDNATQVQVIVESAISGTSYFDASRLGVAPVQRYTVPTTILELHYVYMQALENDEIANYRGIKQGGPSRQLEDIGGRPISLRRLRLLGQAPLSTVSSDTATTEIGGAQVHALISRAEFHFWNAVAAQSAREDTERYEKMAVAALEEYGRLITSPSIRMSPLGSQERRGVWHTEDDSSGQYLIFTQAPI